MSSATGLNRALSPEELPPFVAADEAVTGARSGFASFFCGFAAFFVLEPVASLVGVVDVVSELLGAGVWLDPDAEE